MSASVASSGTAGTAKPVGIFRHNPTEGPGYFATFLDDRRIPWQLFRVDQGEAIPASAAAFSGLVFMGGPMSVNDPLPWISHTLRLIRQAVDAGVPVLGHCLGGQLISKALGAMVTRNPVKEIGWGPVQVADTPVARAWFGDLRQFETFHWHGETFSLPEGANLILSSPACAHQAYAIGKHLAMQCHVEMTEEMVRVWGEAGAREIAANPVPTVQSAAAMCDHLPARVRALNQIAERLYTRWVEGLVR
jgi:GMP synthase-like glutamine amidotransferase